MELWDIYDIDRVRTGRVAQRGKPASEGDWGKASTIWWCTSASLTGADSFCCSSARRTRRATPTSGTLLAAGSALAGRK